MFKFFKKISVVFWLLWWVTTLWTDIIGYIVYFYGFRASWASAGNFLFLVRSLKKYSVPFIVDKLLYIGIIFISFIVFIMFLYATIKITSREWLKYANIAFIFALLYWMLFFISDQIVMNFVLEANHMIQASFMLLNFIVINLLPDDDHSIK